jgi:hypothetical protein
MCLNFVTKKRRNGAPCEFFYIYFQTLCMYDSFSFETYFVPKPTGSIIFYSFFYSIGSICFCSCILRFVLRKGKSDMVADKKNCKETLEC